MGEGKALPCRNSIIGGWQIRSKFSDPENDKTRDRGINGLFSCSSRSQMSLRSSWNAESAEEINIKFYYSALGGAKQTLYTYPYSDVDSRQRRPPKGRGLALIDWPYILYLSRILCAPNPILGDIFHLEPKNYI
jgi:hypothetical protein